VIDIKYNCPIEHLIYAFPNGQRVPEPLLEPGQVGRVQHDNETLVERVNFKHGYKVSPGWRYHSSGSIYSLDAALINELGWTYRDSRPDFRKGEEYFVMLHPGKEPVNIRILTQTSLNARAHVYFTYGEMNILYLMPKTSLKEMIVQKKSGNAPPQDDADLHKVGV